MSTIDSRMSRLLQRTQRLAAARGELVGQTDGPAAEEPDDPEAQRIGNIIDRSRAIDAKRIIDDPRETPQNKVNAAGLLRDRLRRQAETIEALKPKPEPLSVQAERAFTSGAGIPSTEYRRVQAERAALEANGTDTSALSDARMLEELDRRDASPHGRGYFEAAPDAPEKPSQLRDFARQAGPGAVRQANAMIAQTAGSAADLLGFPEAGEGFRSQAEITQAMTPAPQTIGGRAGQIVGSIAPAAVAIAAPEAAPAVMAHFGVQGFGSAEQQYRSRAAERGETPDATTGALAGLAGAAAEILGEKIGLDLIGRIGARQADALIDLMRQGKRADALRVLRTAAESAGVNASEEGLTQLINNVAARELYAPEQRATEGVAESAIAGAIGGPIMGAVGAGVNVAGRLAESAQARANAAVQKDAAAAAAPRDEFGRVNVKVRDGRREQQAGTVDQQEGGGGVDGEALDPIVVGGVVSRPVTAGELPPGTAGDGENVGDAGRAEGEPIQGTGAVGDEVAPKGGTQGQTPAQRAAEIEGILAGNPAMPEAQRMALVREWEQAAADAAEAEERGDADKGGGGGSLFPRTAPQTAQPTAQPAGGTRGGGDARGDAVAGQGNDSPRFPVTPEDHGGVGRKAPEAEPGIFTTPPSTPTAERVVDGQPVDGGGAVGVGEGVGDGGSHSENDNARLIEYAKIGRGHARLARNLQALVTSDTLTPEGRDVILEAFRDADTEHLFHRATVRSSATLSKLTGGRTNPLGASVQRGPSKKGARIQVFAFVQRGVLKRRDQAHERGEPDASFYRRSDTEPVVGVLHELAHSFMRTMATPEEIQAVIDDFNSRTPQERADFLLGGLSTGGRHAAVTEYLASTPDEWIAQAFAEYVLTNRVPAETMRPLLQRLGDLFRKALERLRLRRPLSPAMTELMERLRTGRAPTPAAPPTPAAAAGPELWQRPLAEWWASDMKPYHNLTGQNRKAAESLHRVAVQDAIEAGKPVPPEVLADYPTLRPQGTPNVQPPDAQPQSQPDPQPSANRPEAVQPSPERRPRPAAPPPPPQAEAVTREPLKGAKGRTSTLELPDGRSLAVTYTLVEAADILPSHDATAGFKPNPGADPNERRYEDPTEGKASRETVQKIAAGPKTGILLADSPTATDGPPIVGPTGVVLGGNARTMGMQLAYSRGKGPGDAIRRETLAAAARFGIPSSETGRFKKPVLVRVLSKEDAGAPGELSRILNQPLTTGKSRATESVSRGSKIDATAAREIAGALGDGSLAEALSDGKRAARILRALRGADAFSEADLVGMMQGGALTPAGKSAIEDALLGAAIQDVRTLAQAPPSVRAAIVRALPSVVKLNRPAEAGGDPGFKRDLALALDGLGELRDSDARSVDDLLSQQTLTAQPWRDNPRAVALMRAIDGDKPTALAKRFARYAEAVDDAQSGQSRLMGNVQTVDEAFDEVFGDAGDSGSSGRDGGGSGALFGPSAEPDGSKIIEKARKHFGTTRDYRETGYILPDGTMLDFSGRHDMDANPAGMEIGGQRSVDHADLGQLVPPGEPHERRLAFQRAGAVRVDFNAGIMDTTGAMTEEQIKTIARGMQKVQPVYKYFEALHPRTGRQVAAESLQGPATMRDIVTALIEVSNAAEAAATGASGPMFGPSADMDGADDEDSDVARIRQDELGFYSRVEDFAAEKIRGPMTGEQILKSMRNGQMPADELVWSGLDEWLTSKAGEKITPGQLMQFMGENRVRLREVSSSGGTNDPRMAEAVGRVDATNGKLGERVEDVLLTGIRDQDGKPVATDRALDAIVDMVNAIDFYGPDRFDPMAPPNRRRAVVEELIDENTRLHLRGGHFFRPALVSEESWEKLQDALADAKEAREERRRLAEELGPAPETRYESYTLPGGSNYREVLLTLPEKDIGTPPGQGRIEKLPNGVYLLVFGGLQDQLFDTREAAEAEQRRLSDQFDRPQKRDRLNYRSPHFNEPNIVAHLRLKDRTTPDGRRVLFAEEIQSDWHQHGRDHGYRSAGGFAKAQDALQQFELKMKEKYGDLFTSRLTAEERLERIGLQEAEHAAFKVEHNGVPAGPFAKTWHELAIRRLARLAAEGGYDAIGWTTGDQQTDRYEGLDQVVQSVRWSTRDNGTSKVVHMRMDGGVYVYVIVENGTITEADYRLRDLQGKTAQEAFGADLASKIESEPDGSSDGFSIGGTGMREFYDKILPRYAAKLGKKFDAKPTQATIETDTASDGATTADGYAAMFKEEGIHLLPITPEMRKTITEQGLPLFGPAAPDHSDPAKPAGKGFPEYLDFDKRSGIPDEVLPPPLVVEMAAFEAARAETVGATYLTRLAAQALGRADTYLKSVATEIERGGIKQADQLAAAAETKRRADDAAAQSVAERLKGNDEEAKRLEMLADRLRDLTAAKPFARREAGGRIRSFASKLGAGYSRLSQQYENRDTGAATAALKGLSATERRDVGRIGLGFLDAADASPKAAAAAAKIQAVMDRGEAGLEAAAAVGLKRRSSRGRYFKLRGSGKWMPQSLNAKGRAVMADMAKAGRESPKLAALVDQIAAERPDMDREDILAELFDYFDSLSRGTNRYFERTRILLPEDYIELDPAKVLPGVIRKNAKTVAAGRVFGGYGETNDLPEVDDVLVTMKEYDPDAAERFAKYIGHELGKPASPANRRGRRIAGSITGIQNVTKLSTIFGPIRNVAQPWINTADYGLIPRLRAYFVDYPLFVGAVVPWGRRAAAVAERAGSTAGRSTAGRQSLAGEEDAALPTKALRGFQNAALYFFRASQRGTEIRADAIARHAAEKALADLAALERPGMGIRKLLVRAANGFGGARSRAAIERRMKRLGMTPARLLEAVIQFNTHGTRLSADELDLAGWHLAHDTQFTLSAASKPLYYENHPLLRIAAQYKGFGLRQTGVMVERAFKEAAHGNLVPLMQFTFAGLVAGELLALLRDWIKGEDKSILGTLRRPGDAGKAREAAERAATHLLRGGLLGAVAETEFGVAGYLAGPTVGAAADVARAGLDVAKRPTLGQAEMAGRRLAERHVPAIGQVGGIIRETLQTEGTKRAAAVAKLRAMGRHDKSAAQVAEQRLFGPERYASGPNSLTYQFAARAINAGDVEEATEYMTELLSGMDGAQLERTVRGLQSSMAASSPLGTMSRGDAAQFLKTLSPAAAQAARTLDREWKRDYTRALRNALRTTRQRRRLP